ncbi:ABC transporter permease [Nocardioides pantholopis]|uniref:ABC transporter permease n=1 Tax=Nocardioides pantholopis TaxID=2483798 RepID=UPI000FD87B8E|nr:ABC transporter permease subunit [Nocardioides pantholopis]
MSAVTATTATDPADQAAPATAGRATPSPIPLSRVVGVELRKMFDTRAGFWLLASIGILSVLATAATILFAPEEELTYEAFASAIGFPMAVILPMIAILAVTSEWSQRSGLTSFTLVPNRSRVILAKAIGAVAIGVVSMFVALVIGALGNVVGTAITGTDVVWDVSVTEFAFIVLANVLGLMVGFMLGVLFRSSAGAIVAYFVYSLLVPTLAELLSSMQDWFADLRPWVDFNYAQTPLFEGVVSGEQWANLAVTGVLWLVLPLAAGIALVMRSEVK